MASETILVIEADTETEQNIVSTLESEGYLVFTSPGGDIGVKMAETVKPSLIFLNPSADETGGLDLCKTIHENISLSDIPIVLLTSFRGSMDARYTSLYGIVDFMRMPFSPEKLVEKTTNILSPKDAAGTITEAPGTATDPPMEKHAAIPTEKAEEDIDFSARTDEDEKPAAAAEEEPSGEAPAQAYYGASYRSTGGMRRRRKKRGLLVPALIGAAVIMVGGASFLYFTLRQGSESPRPVAVRTAPAEQAQPDVKTPPPSQEETSAGIKAVPASPAQSVKPLPESIPPPVQAKTPSATASAGPTAAGKQKGTPFYSVQVGAFGRPGTAEALAKKYSDKGYDASSRQGVAKNGKEIYRVLIGKFDSRKEAGKMAAEIQTKEKIKTIIYSE